MSTSVIKFYTKFLGLHNLKDPARIPEDEGVCALDTATNIDIDGTFMMHRRDGYTSVIGGNYHSLWSDGKVLFAVKSGGLVQVDPTGGVYTETVLSRGVGDSPMAYADVNGTTYYSNGEYIGKVTDGVQSDLSTTTEQYKAVMPAGDIVEFYKGVLYVVQGKTVYYSDAMHFDRMDRRKNFLQFEEEVTMFKGTADGIYVSCGATYFLRGDSPAKFTRHRVSDFGAIKRTEAKIDKMIVGEQLLDDAVIWSSKDGIHVGGKGGVSFSLTSRKHEMPTVSQQGAATIRRKRDTNINQYITNLK